MSGSYSSQWLALDLRIPVCTPSVARESYTLNPEKSVYLFALNLDPAAGQSPADAAPFSGEIQVTEGRMHGAALSTNDGFVLDLILVDGNELPWTGALVAEDGGLVSVPDGVSWTGSSLQNSSALTTWAFESELGALGTWIVTLSVFLFALSTGFDMRA